MAHGGEAGEVQVEVVGVFEQRSAGEGEEGLTRPVLVLRDAAQRELHMPVGSCEALAVHLALSRQLIPRPLTHDLALRILERLSAEIQRVVIARHPIDGYQSVIYLKASEGEVVLPAQPGDAVAIALRADAPVYVTEETLSQPTGDEQ